MILPFSTQLNGKPTYFVESIWEGLLRNVFDEDKEYQEYLRLHKKKFDVYWDWFPEDHKRLEYPKIHTIREDKKDRWKPGTKIDFFINCRQKDMFRFAPVLPVVITQKIEFIWKENIEKHTCLGTKFDRTCTVRIDDRFYGDAYLLNGSLISSSYTIKTLAQNDGFDCEEDFFAYFNATYIGKIIHWTEKRY